ncbi:MAG: hypothetical protein H6729_09980 [Deltaproteobacteria bacterium]|nr:hypothetical protein [Deltaproteobacteria bacterium]
MMTNLDDLTAPRPIAQEIVNSFSAYIDHNQKLNMLFAPRDGCSQFNAEPATSIEGVELRVDYSHEE